MKKQLTILFLLFLSLLFLANTSGNKYERIENTGVFETAAGTAVKAAKLFIGFDTRANEVKKNISNPEAEVLICTSKSAYAYHSYYCRGLKQCKSNVVKISVSEAKRRGYIPCKICY